MINMDIAITKMSSKGQVVVPVEMRENFKEGEKIIIIQNGDQLIMKKVDAMSKQLQEDLDFAKRTEEALERYERGEGKWKEMDFDDFLKEFDKW
jgi:bifunctional DNA-binding transcriptional regulator/antitoxin component of YhaV-PrlF toxin-antitoxin module